MPSHLPDRRAAVVADAVVPLKKRGPEPFDVGPLRSDGPPLPPAPAYLLRSVAFHELDASSQLRKVLTPCPEPRERDRITFTILTHSWSSNPAPQSCGKTTRRQQPRPPKRLVSNRHQSRRSGVWVTPASRRTEASRQVSASILSGMGVCPVRSPRDPLLMLR